MTKDEEKAVVLTVVLNAFFASVVNSKTRCSQGTRPPELEDTEGEQNEALIIQAEMVSNLLHHTDAHTSLWGQMGSTQGY